MRLLIDTNIFVDVARQRVPHLAASEAVVKWCESHPGSGLIAWHTLSNLYYLIGDDVRARQFIAGVLETFEIPATGTARGKLSLRLPIRNFEDAMQIAAAIEAGADMIVTRDEADFRRSPVPVQSPRAFLAALAK